MARQPRLTESYDWIVLGDSLPALLSAAMVARMGLSVLVVGDGSEKKWRISSNGQVIDPEPNFASSLGHPNFRLGVGGRCLQSLRFLDSEWSSVIVEDPVFQAVTPHLRSEYGVEFDSTSRSIARESLLHDSVISQLAAVLSAATPAISQFWGALPERLTLPVGQGSESNVKDRKPAREIAAAFEAASEARFCRELFKEVIGDSSYRRWSDETSGFEAFKISEQEKEWIDAWLSAEFAGEVPHSLAPYDVIRALALSTTGVRFRGGLSAFRALLLRLVLRLGAHVLDTSAGVSRIFVEESKVLGVQLSGAEGARNLTRARGILTSIHPLRISSLMPGAGKPHDLRDDDLLRVTLALTVPKSCIPVGMAKRVIWKESGAPSLELERAIPQEYGFRLESSEYVFLRGCFPMEAQDWSVERWRTVCERMFRQAGEVMPFLEASVEKIFPDFRTPEFADQWNEFYGVNRLASVDLFRVPVTPSPKSPPVEGLFQVHRRMAPNLGFLGEWSESLHATAWIAHRSGLAGPLG